MMQRLLSTTLSLLLSLLCSAQILSSNAHWIAVADTQVDSINSWTTFRKDVRISKVPKQVKAVIAADSKYWLWINGKLAVFEGGLKRGPNPKDTYYDEVDIAPFLKKGNNQLAILLWHFGKSGYSHTDSGKAGLLVDVPALKLQSDATWKARLHPAYSKADINTPNYRLSESDICFDARKDIEGWQTQDINALPSFANAIERGKCGSAPWNQLHKRPIPQWKDFGIIAAPMDRHKGYMLDTIVAQLPYNMQMTPILKVNDPKGGQKINILTNHSNAGGDTNLNAQYITKQGEQTYENLGWLNGEQIILIVPHDLPTEQVSYRQTGYDTWQEGSFTCSDPFINRFWEKAMRTLYVNMRDTFFDCPDRERAQWWGDVTLMMAELAYTYSNSTNLLMQKAIHQLIDHQNAEGVLHSPIPGNALDELPGQMLASIGQYGIWSYYMNTGDKDLLAEIYPAVKKYLDLWKLDKEGMTEIRQGGWVWGDWGQHHDLRLLMAGWHYLALQGVAQMADVLGFAQDAQIYRQRMETIKKAYNHCWNGYAYRHPTYQDATDDRAQAMAVITGIADSTQYTQILSLLGTQKYASPYMEKYVMEALMQMGQGNTALDRFKERFEPMVDDSIHSTLYEGWETENMLWGGGTTNHAWSGGPVIVISRYICGIYPLEAGYSTFAIEPNPCTLSQASISVPSVKGLIQSAFKVEDKKLSMDITVPSGTQAVLLLSEENSYQINQKEPSGNQLQVPSAYQKKGKKAYLLEAGHYEIQTTK